MKAFTIPYSYRSALISAIKTRRRQEDKMKKDFSPSLLDFGPVKIYLARHFGFCYGVENAIEIAFRTIDENPGKKIFLLSEMIHNPGVNADLLARGVQFLQDTKGNQLVDFNELNKEDIVIIPAFGTTLKIENILKAKEIEIERYDTTCPFVEKVWNRSRQIALSSYSVIVHGKPSHEETRATFSHAAANAPTLVLKDMDDAVLLADYIKERKPVEDFYEDFKGRYSDNFDPAEHLERFGVVNQTTMLASDTQAIADYLKQAMIDKYDLQNDTIDERFADTRDTLCYATNDNQTAVYELLKTPGDLAIVVGGYNSSNTSHLVELCEKQLPTYFIENAENIISQKEIRHFDLHTKKENVTPGYLTNNPVKILITSGASCPDAVVENVIEKIVSFYSSAAPIKEIIKQFN